MQIEPRKVNPWLLQKLKEKRLADEKGEVHSGQMLELIVETTPDKALQVAEDIRRLGITVYTVRISWGRYVPIYARVEDIPRIQALPDVRKIHYSMPRFPYILPFAASKFDPLIGLVKVSEVEVTTSPFGVPLNLIAGFITQPLNLLAGVFQPQKPGTRLIPTSETRKIIEAPEENVITKTKVAIIDTGGPLQFHHAWRMGGTYVSTTGEPPYDGLGHHTHVSTIALGAELPTRFGKLKGVARPVSGELVLHIKALTNAGFGSTASVLKAMEIAYEWGSNIVNMSLGGPSQGGVDDDPESRIIMETGDEVMWIVASGNEGPDEYTIGSPAFSPKALTVGAASYPEVEEPTWYSSRGPSSQWYKEHPEEWRRDYAKYGDNLIKPDVLAPGVGRPSEDLKPDTFVYAGTQGWYDSVVDLTLEGLEAMHGSSMATPHVTGLCALLVDRGLISNTADVKRVMCGRVGGKNINRGFGLLKYSYFVGG